MCAWNASIGATQACTGGLGSGYGETEDYYVNIVPCVSITTQPQDTTICSGNNASFSIAGTSISNYQWQVSTNGGTSWANTANGGVYSGVTTPTLLITGATTGMHNYQYRCVATNSGSSCSINTPARTLKVN